MKLIRRSLHALLWTSILCCCGGQAQSTEDDAVQRYSEVGQKALAAGRYDIAEQNFLSLEKLEPSVAEVHATLAVIYFQEKRFDQAVVEIHQALKLKPTLTKLNSLLAMSLSELGQYQEAVPELQRAFKQSADPEVKRMSGLQLMRAYSGLHQDSRAVEVALQLDQLFPNDAEILYNTGKVYGNYAFLTMTKLSEDAPNSVWRHLAAAEALESQGSTADALHEYRAIVSIEPRRIGIHYRIGRTLLKQYHQDGNKAEVEQARQEFDLELQLDPGNANAAYELAEMDRQAGDYARAEENFSRALKDYPEFEEAQVGLAAVYMAQKKPAEALPLLQSAVASHPEDEVSWYRLSQVDRSLGRKDEQQDAIAHFQKLHQAQADRLLNDKLTDSASEVTKQQIEPESNN
jgi:tetratricopeptide (TPR) repeat protein